MTSYYTRLETISGQRGRLCVGIDPSPQMLDIWGLPHSVSGLERLARGMVAAVGDLVACLKPQAGFFEPYGSAGVAVLERVLDDIRQSGSLSILDVKRGDIGSTMVGYAQATLAAGAPLEADAVTLNPFLGFETLRPAMSLANANGKGVYLLARTSNPEGGQVQLAKPAAHPSVAQMIIDMATNENESTGLYSVGLVVGATHQQLGCDLSQFNGSILAPGIGTQGAQMADVAEVFGTAAPLVVASASRQVISAGPDTGALRQQVARLLGDEND